MPEDIPITENMRVDFSKTFPQKSPLMLAFLTRYVRESLSPGAKFAVRMTYSYTSTLLLYPKSRYLPDAGFGWTLKPRY
jgi:hypothetical protein